jgi:AcrR family transcriptional regulator
MPTRISKSQRRDQIIESAESIIEEIGIADCTMSAIADRAGITRAWLYKFFPDVESVLVAVWMSWQLPGALGTEVMSPVGEFAVLSHMRSCIDLWLRMPLGAAMIGNYGLISTVGDSTIGSRLNNLMWEDWEQRWVGPLERGGIPREVAIGVVVTVHASAVGVLLAMHQGRLHREAARAVLSQIVDGVTDPSWRITRTPVGT